MKVAQRDHSASETKIETPRNAWRWFSSISLKFLIICHMKDDEITESKTMYTQAQYRTIHVCYF